MGEVAEVREGDEADVVEVVGVVRAGDELLPEAEEGRAAGHGVVDGVVALGDDGGGS